MLLRFHDLHSAVLFHLRNHGLCRRFYHLGLIQRETADTVYLTNPAGEEIPIAREGIAAITPQAISLMPQGLEQALEEQDLLDLVAFLKSCQ